jgi:hypothetical protein
MHTKRFVITLLPLLVGSMLAWPAMGQSTGLVVFDSSEDALYGTSACNGIGNSPITLVQSDTDGSGNNANQASNVSATACGGQSLFSAQSASESTSAQDLVAQDDGAGSSQEQNVSLLGGLVSYASKSESDNCSTPDGINISCSDATSLSDLYFNGQRITGTYDSPTTFQAVNVKVEVVGCTGVDLFTGQLTVGGSTVQLSSDGQSGTVQMIPLELQGTLNCLGIPLGSMTVDLKDFSSIYAIKEFSYLGDFSLAVGEKVDVE